MASQEIEALSSALARLPGLGPRSARRAVLWLVKHRETALGHAVAAEAEDAIDAGKAVRVGDRGPRVALARSPACQRC